MNSLATNKALSLEPCGDLMSLAEQELSAFFHGVMQSVGSEQARLSAEDWLQALTESDDLPASREEWRSISVKVSNRLARRVNALALSVSTEFIIA